MARTRGMEIATTSPALKPRLRKLTTSTMAIASKRASVKPPIASRTTSGWSETSLSSMPTGRRCIRRSAASCRPSPKVRLLPPDAHVDADADRRLAVDAKHLGGRVAVAVLDLGDVGQLVEAPVDPEVELGDGFRRQEGAGDVDEHVLTRRVDDAGGHHGILLGDRREHVVEVELEVGELLRREVQIDLLVLVAEDVDLADIRRAQELGPHGLGEVARLARREAVIGDAVDDAEDIAELVVEEGPDHVLAVRWP